MEPHRICGWQADRHHSLIHYAMMTDAKADAEARKTIPKPRSFGTAFRTAAGHCETDNDIIWISRQSCEFPERGDQRNLLQQYEVFGVGTPPIRIAGGNHRHRPDNP